MVKQETSPGLAFTQLTLSSESFLLLSIILWIWKDNRLPVASKLCTLIAASLQGFLKIIKKTKIMAKDLVLYCHRILLQHWAAMGKRGYMCVHIYMYIYNYVVCLVCDPALSLKKKQQSLNSFTHSHHRPPGKGKVQGGRDSQLGRQVMQSWGPGRGAEVPTAHRKN